MKTFRILILVTTIFWYLALPGIAFARSIDLPVMDDKVVLGGIFTLESNEVLDGSLVILGGVVLLEEDSSVEGDVVVFGGNLSVQGEVNQNLLAIGGVLSLSDTAVIYGDLVALATAFKQAPGANVYGQVLTDSVPHEIDIPEIPEIPDIPDIPDVPDIPDIPGVPEFNFRTRPFVFFDTFAFTLTSFTEMWLFVIRVFAFSAVAIFLAMFLPEHLKRTGNTILSYPILSGGLGILSIVISFPIIGVLTILILPIPLVVLLSLALGLGLFFGWLAIGLETGRKISESVKREWSIPLQAGLGTFALTFVVGIFGLILWEWVSAILMVIICAIGLGAVLLTRFGSREYIPGESSGEGEVGSIE